MRHEREAKALTKALAPYRSGRQGELCVRVRCMLVRLMGFANCDDIPVGVREIPHWFPRRSGLEPDEMIDFAAVAHDALRELGYDAAADLLTRWGTRNGDVLPVSAREALVNLESGPPSVMIDQRPIVTKTIRRYKIPSGTEYLVGRNVSDPRWWYRFTRGRAVHNGRGDYVGWDSEAGYTFTRRGRSLEDVLAAKYGSVALR